MMVFRLSPVSRSVERIEQPSSKHWIARAATSGFASIVSRVNLSWGSQNVDWQEVQRQRWIRRLPKYPNFLQEWCWHLMQVMAFLRLISAGKSHILTLGLECGLTRALD
jgi:hypothetical protein